MMKTSLIFLLAAIGFAPVSAQSDFWKEVPVPHGSGSVYTFVDFADTLTGVLCSADGHFTITGDAGRSWTSSVRISDAAQIIAVKMADSATVLLASAPSTGNTKIYKITRQGPAWGSSQIVTRDSLQLPIALPNGGGARGMVSILNKERIGYVDRIKGKFFSTRDFGASWDSLVVGTKFHTSVQALDSATLFLATGTGIAGMGGDGSLDRSDDNGKTFVPMANNIDDANIKIFTKEFACFDLIVNTDLYPSYTTLLLYNLITKGSSGLGGINNSFTGLGTCFADGSSIAVSAYSHLVPAGDSLYVISGAVASDKDSLRYSTIAIAGKNSVWYLTGEGRLFTYADDPLQTQGFFPLQLGNRWQYESADVMHPSPIVESKIVGDTLMANGRRYAIMAGSMLGSPYLRREGSRVYAFDGVDSAEYVLMDINAKPSDTLSTHSKGKWTNVAGGRLLIPESPLSYWKFYQYMNVGLSGYIFADWTIQESVGLVSVTGEPGNKWNLRGAIIDGKTIGTITGIREEVPIIPAKPVLHQNYPNPFNPSTTISFMLPSKSHVTLAIFDVMGRKVWTLVSEDLPAGSHQRQWNASGCASGMYFYRLTAGAYAETKRLLLVR
jgi:hypothetical protein